MEDSPATLPESSGPGGPATRRRRAVFVSLAVLIPFTGLAALLSFGTFGDTSRLGAVEVEGTRVAAGFKLPSFGGGEISLADYRGSPVFLYFWASWCVPCREEAPMLEALWREYKPRGIVFLGVNIQDREGEARDFLREFEITFPNVRDADGRVYIEYGVYGVPDSFFIRPDGTIASRWIGGMKEDQLSPILDGLLAK